MKLCPFLVFSSLIRLLFAVEAYFVNQHYIKLQIQYTDKVTKTFTLPYNTLNTLQNLTMAD